jgi:polysaccharide pyruvyl transferase WcaK-like protein
MHNVSESSDTRHKPVKIGLLGASFDTGNMGVNALAESSIKIILNRWPEAEIVLLGSGLTPQEQKLPVLDRQVVLKTLPIRFSKNLFLPYHFLKFAAYALLVKILPGRRLKKSVTERNPYFKLLSQTDFVVDITGGDSFSNIYGFRRFLLGFLYKWLVIFSGKKLVLLPQTYGPFKGLLTRKMAGYILNKATVVYSRDQAGIEHVNALLNNRRNGKIRFAPDVAFILDPRRPDNQDIDSLERIKTSNRILVGLNVSGLLSCCGDASNNVFNLKVDYHALVNSIVESLMKHDDTAILLVPHLVALHESDALLGKSMPKKGYREQSDTVPCGKIYERFSAKYNNRIFLVRGHYDHNETKYIIGLCDFFIGSRMHACIAALSQCISAVGLAYSKKFSGVFESIGLADCVVDARSLDEREVLEKLGTVFERRGQIRKHLQDVMPKVRKDVLSIFDNGLFKES